jgi:two-component system sensor histidine kinase QseC
VRASLRSRLLLGAAVSTALVLSASGGVLYVLMRAALFSEFDGALGTRARALAMLVEQDKDEVDAEFEERDLPEFARAGRPEYLELWLDDGRVLYRSPSLGRGDLERIGGPPGAPAFRPVTLPDGRRGRLAGITFVPKQEREGRGHPREVTLAIARETRDVDATLARLGVLLVGVCAAATLVSVGLLAWVVRRGLRPVGHLAAQIGSVGEADLSARIGLAGAPSELLPVVQRLNDLLARLEGAFNREKSFTADVAHELRTPLAGLQATLEVGLSRERESAVYRAAMSECLTICRQMHAMVDNLLSLARAEAGQLEVAWEPVPLEEALRECWGPLAPQAEARGLRVEWGVDPDAALHTDRESLRLILHNILENAVSYADAGGYVRIESSSEDGRTVLTVANSGSTLTPGQATHVFERFWRGDAARSGTGIHCGLGLALCEKLVKLLGGSISVESVAGGTFTVRLAFAAPGAP